MRRNQRLRNRKGATIVLVAMMLFVLVGMAGIAIDFSRMYLYRTQAQTTADAASHAAAMQLIPPRIRTQAPDTAMLGYRPRNLVNNTLAVMAYDSVWGGHWDIAARTFTPIVSGLNPAGWTDPAVNSVRVRAGTIGNTTLSRVFGAATLQTTVEAIAAVGYVGSTDCLHPWAVSYQTILDALYPPAGTKPTSYDLSPADIQTLTAMSYPANAVKLLQSTGDPVTPGNIAQVVVNDPWAGNNYYTGAISQDPSIFPPDGCPNLPIGPGTWLDTDPGAGGGQTFNGLEAFCENNGGLEPGASQNKFTCSAQPRVKLAMWDINNGESGNNLKYRVKYVGVFAVVKFTKTTPGGGVAPQIEGYFTSMATTGALTGTPSPLLGVALVQ